MQPLEDYLEARRAEIDAALMRYLPQPPHTPAVVSDAMRYSLMAGGKRLRPILTLAAADAIVARLTGSAQATTVRRSFTRTRKPLAPAGHDADGRAASTMSRAMGDRDGDVLAAALEPHRMGERARALALPAACAVEMIHTYSLIHDDLPAMDDDTLRRGRPTLHVVAGDGMAILAGDGLQAAAFALLAREPSSDDAHVATRKLRVIEIVAEAAGPAGMVGGQAIDLEAVRPTAGKPVEPLDAAAVEAMHARKTGALIRASAVSGAVMAGAGESLIAAVDGFAREIGLAFQILDDILDVEAGSEALGKTAGKDAAAGKPTYPSLFGLERSRTLAAECLARAEQSLADAELVDSHLAGIARWIVHRRS